MNKTLLSLIAFLCAVTFTPSAHATNYGVVISNSEDTSIQIGLVDYLNVSYAPPPSLVITNLVYNSGYYQQSTYNYNTQVLTFIATDPVTQNTFLYTVDCDEWSIINSLSFPGGAELRGLASDQTNNNNPFNIWTTAQTGNGLVIVSKIDQLSLDIVIYDILDGNYYSSTLGSNEDYFVTYGNSSGIFVNVYSTLHHKISEQKFGFSDIAETPKGPINMIYSKFTNTLLATVIVSTDNTSSFSTLAFVDRKSSTFQITTMASFANSIPEANVPDANNLNYVYSVGYVGSQYYLYSYNIYTQLLLNAAPISIPIAAAF
ncbi:hypothetical protein CYY_002038 [Polysphondylium violaceum]|uniref:Uncharacterized protein n=1 Tax=Polysphondylium violaceum TaxID=133409 RepID=A0A8J4PXE8_9MYCE|nr:hypothetical protein CYY_002038 [Polysphondylium violaceum]